jgi:uncharacterized protein YwqG
VTPERTIEQTGRDAFLLKPAPLPTLSGGTARSFFGGLALMPRGTPWPHKPVDSRLRPLTFVAQIRLEDLPPFAGSPLPGEGSLCFFLDLTHEWLDPVDARVLYFDEPFESLIEHLSPLQFTSEPIEPWFWLDPEEITTCPLYKHAIEFFRFRSYATYAMGVRTPDDEAACTLLQRRELESLANANAPPATWNFDAADDDWPFAWSVIEHATRALLARVQQGTRNARTAHTGPLQGLVPGIEGWLERARARDGMEAADPGTRAEFRSNWGEWRAHVAEALSKSYRSFDVNACLAEAIRVTACLCERDLELAVPTQFRAAIDGEWTSDLLRTAQDLPLDALGQTQMLGYAEAHQPTTKDRIDDVLLLQIKPEVFGPWWPDAGYEGAIHFWISPEDLAARRFERVTVNFDCT